MKPEKKPVGVAGSFYSPQNKSTMEEMYQNINDIPHSKEGRILVLAIGKLMGLYPNKDADSILTELEHQDLQNRATQG